jgi:dihydrodipicolinate synthase/N-acetylneuraminate lyase
MELKKGFYPALGTPKDENGNVLEESYRKQIELMIEAGASGALCMGSMGTEVIFTLSQYKEVAC